MAKTTGITWATATWNPWMGCTKVSAGCKACYMFRDQKKYGHDPTQIRRSKTTFNDPLKWEKPERIFVCSWSDFFHPDVPDEWRAEALSVMKDAPQHDYLILTKRPELIGEQVGGRLWWNILERIWLGVSVENNSFVYRIPQIKFIPTLVHFVSVEPMIGPVDLRDHLDKLDWVIIGGESGYNPRPMEKAWVLDLIGQCREGGVPVFFKQWGGSKKIDGDWGGYLIDGKEYREFPMTLTDRVYIHYDLKRERYYLQRGRETFYDDQNRMRSWDTEEEARRWSVANLGIDPRYQGPKVEPKNDEDQLPLFQRENTDGEEDNP